jgi:hypothetical protein
VFVFGIAGIYWGRENLLENPKIYERKKEGVGNILQPRFG